GNRFRFNEDNHLPFDLVIVDEASMLDINMWVRLIRAIGPKTKLIVLGDKDQLASVEAGSILGDICRGDNSFSETILHVIAKLTGASIPKAKECIPDINDCIVFLTKSYRFSHNSGIKLLADAINEQDADTVLQLLTDDQFRDVDWLDHGKEARDKVINEYGLDLYHHFSGLSQEKRMEASNKRKILCAIRKSKFGVESINLDVEIGIKRKKGLFWNNEWYDGRLIMAVRNDAALRVRNGEMGIYNHQLKKIRFEGEHKVEFSPVRISDYECAYAITIHKSQGSEFDNVAIVLPERFSGVLSKEILYTAVTRARKNTLVIGSKEIIKKTVERSVNRKSGLKGKIWHK
ncbi:MAG TPA: exodeoxyribonuclease V subunit alpha, partial [Bacteroidales bacterium]|nr:exodeoxyribonuclease V subunit alpha [Bacteroidales bacterium]